MLCIYIWQLPKLIQIILGFARIKKLMNKHSGSNSELYLEGQCLDVYTYGSSIFNLITFQKMRMSKKSQQEQQQKNTIHNKNNNSKHP